MMRSRDAGERQRPAPSAAATAATPRSADVEEIEPPEPSGDAICQSPPSPPPLSIERSGTRSGPGQRDHGRRDRDDTQAPDVRSAARRAVRAAVAMVEHRIAETRSARGRDTAGLLAREHGRHSPARGAARGTGPLPSQVRTASASSMEHRRDARPSIRGSASPAPLGRARPLPASAGSSPTCASGGPGSAFLTDRHPFHSRRAAIRRCLATAAPRPVPRAAAWWGCRRARARPPSGRRVTACRARRRAACRRASRAPARPDSSPIISSAAVDADPGSAAGCCTRRRGRRSRARAGSRAHGVADEEGEVARLRADRRTATAPSPGELRALHRCGRPAVRALARAARPNEVAHAAGSATKAVRLRLQPAAGARRRAC